MYIPDPCHVEATTQFHEYAKEMRTIRLTQNLPGKQYEHRLRLHFRRCIRLDLTLLISAIAQKIVINWPVVITWVSRHDVGGRLTLKSWDIKYYDWNDDVLMDLEAVLKLSWMGSESQMSSPH